MAETGSAVAEELLKRWPEAVAEFTAVVPRDYRRVLEIMRAAEAAGRDVDDAVMTELTAPAVPAIAGAARPAGRLPRRWHVPDPNGFLRYDRRLPARRPVPVRISDWREVYPPAGEELVREQATRCMDCGIPFCHDGCPLGNRIPDWNDLVRTGNWDAAVESLHATNNFPEFTGRLCPAPCEAACVLGISGGAAGDHQAGRGGDRRPRRRRAGSRPARCRRRRAGRSPSSVPGPPDSPPPSSSPAPVTR